MGAAARRFSRQDDCIEGTVCDESDLHDGQMKTFPLGDEEGNKVLVVKHNGVISAIGTKCTHYGAPLEKGALSHGRVRCPWHGACFSVTTGDIEDFPGLDSIPCYKVKVVEGKVKIKAPKKMLKDNRVVKRGARRNLKLDETYLIIGGGGAAAAAAETLREAGFKGRVVMATQERFLPYDRPKLSKSLDITGEKLALRSEEFYVDRDIEVQMLRKAVDVDTKQSIVTFSEGDPIRYDKLLIATGASPRKLAVTGSDLNNVCVLRTPDDGNFIAAHSQDKKVVVIGTSFIGMEAASFLVNKAASVTVIGTSDVPYSRTLGPDVGASIRKLHEEKGVNFVMNSDVKEFKGVSGSVEEVVLKDGHVIPADLVVTGIGVEPNSKFLAHSDVTVDERGYVLVGEDFETNVTNVFAAGDIASFPLFLNGERVCIGHWGMAHAHGRTAALNMAGKPKKIHSVPFFWTQMYGKSIRYAGYAGNYDQTVLDGDVEGLSFVAYYCLGPRVTAVATVNRDPVAAKFAELLNAGKSLVTLEVQQDPKRWLEQYN